MASLMLQVVGIGALVLVIAKAAAAAASVRLNVFIVAFSLHRLFIGTTHQRQVRHITSSQFLMRSKPALAPLEFMFRMKKFPEKNFLFLFTYKRSQKNTRYQSIKWRLFSLLLLLLLQTEVLCLAGLRLAFKVSEFFEVI